MKILIRQVDERVFQLHFQNIYLAECCSFSWFPGGPALSVHHRIVRFACTFDLFPILSVYIVMSSRQGFLLF